MSKQASRRITRRFVIAAKRGILGTSLALAIALPASADDAAVAANQLLVAQLADAVTTRWVLAPKAGWNEIERDPLARPFVQTNASALSFYVAQNLIARLLFRHSPTVVRLLTGVELISAGNNVFQRERH